MPVAAIEIQNLRSIAELRLQPGARWNWLVGANGAGKSTVLEALHLLGTGQSWRRGQRQLVREGAKQYRLRSALDQVGGLAWLGMEREGEQRQLVFDGRKIDSAWELLEILPLQAWHDENAHFVTSPAEERRRILDWGVFFADPGYGQHLRQYRRALQQRNAALRQRQNPHPWNPALAQRGESLQEARQSHLERLRPHFQTLWADSPQAGQPVDVELQAGWGEDLSLLAALEQDSLRDQEGAFTHSGPHRAQLRFRVAGRAAADILSRGQLRLLGITFRLAQLAVYRDAGLPQPLVLIDDFASELDADARRWWYRVLSDFSVQVLAAVTESGHIPDPAQAHQFHLAAGQLLKEVHP